MIIHKLYPQSFPEPEKKERKKLREKNDSGNSD
jgi:hypothetical protein